MGVFLLGLLKIIGIILLILLVLLLVILGIVLFVPIRYQGAGQISEEKKEATAQVTWLLKAVRCRVDYRYPEKPVISVKVLWIDVLKLLEKRKNKAASKSARETAAEEAASTVEEQVEETTSTSQEASGALEEEALPEEKVPLKEKIENIIFKITSIYDKIKNVIYNIKYYIGVLQEEDTKQLLANAWGAIGKILKSIRPRVFELKGEFGFAAPDTTGQAYGAYCAVRPLLGEHVQLVANFEKQVIHGDLRLKGRITIFVIVINTLRILFDKRLQPLINKLKNGGNQNGRE